MLDDSKEAGIGHNSGADLPYDVTKFQPLELRAREIADAGADWIKLPKIETEEQAQKANDFLAQVKKIEKDTEAERKAQKAPHDARAKAVDAAFKLLLDPLGKIAGPVKNKLLAFAQPGTTARGRRTAGRGPAPAGDLPQRSPKPSGQPQPLPATGRRARAAASQR